MTVLGITGGSGVGKTTLLSRVAARGGVVVDCDAVYHGLLERDTALQSALEREFGPLRDGSDRIDRKKLGTIVFSDPERLETLFDSYHQAERPAPPPQGLGLGLALCQGIAKGHGGIMTAESRQGKGSRFTFSMPDRLSGTALSDVRFDYSGGFNRALMSLSDTLPSEAFTIRNH